MDTDASGHRRLSLKQNAKNLLQQRRAQWYELKQTQSQDQSASQNADPLQKPPAAQNVIQ